MSRIDQAVEYFKEGYACSQAVLVAFCPEYGLDKDTALRLADGFGGGVGRKGLMCGAVAGAVMVLGLSFGRTNAKDQHAKDKLNTKIGEFIDKFHTRHQSIVCKELLGYDISTKQGLTAASQNKLFDTQCPEYVRTAAEILQEILSPES